jgi:hypothetical protein
MNTDPREHDMTETVANRIARALAAQSADGAALADYMSNDGYPGDTPPAGPGARYCGTKSATDPAFICTLATATHGAAFHIAHDVDDHEVYRWPVAGCSTPALHSTGRCACTYRPRHAAPAPLDAAGLAELETAINGTCDICGAPWTPAHVEC